MLHAQMIIAADSFSKHIITGNPNQTLHKEFISCDVFINGVRDQNINI